MYISEGRFSKYVSESHSSQVKRYRGSRTTRIFAREKTCGGCEKSRRTVPHTRVKNPKIKNHLYLNPGNRNGLIQGQHNRIVKRPGSASAKQKRSSEFPHALLRAAFCPEDEQRRGKLTAFRTGLKYARNTRAPIAQALRIFVARNICTSAVLILLRRTIPTRTCWCCSVSRK